MRKIKIQKHLVHIYGSNQAEAEEIEAGIVDKGSITSILSEIDATPVILKQTSMFFKNPVSLLKNDSTDYAKSWNELIKHIHNNMTSYSVQGHVNIVSNEEAKEFLRKDGSILRGNLKHLQSLNMQIWIICDHEVNSY